MCDECLFDRERKVSMAGKFYIEGHKSKENWEDENTVIIESSEDFSSLEEATTRAKEFFDKEKELGLMVIFREGREGSKEGVKFIFKTDEGNLEESDLFW
jgi:hypothetical protein